MSNVPTPPPAGWYPDPYDRDAERYHTGRDWSEQTRPVGATTPAIPVTARPVSPGLSAVTVPAVTVPAAVAARTHPQRRLAILGVTVFFVLIAAILASNWIAGGGLPHIVTVILIVIEVILAIPLIWYLAVGRRD